MYVCSVYISSGYYKVIASLFSTVSITSQNTICDINILLNVAKILGRLGYGKREN